MSVPPTEPDDVGNKLASFTLTLFSIIILGFAVVQYFTNPNKMQAVVIGMVGVGAAVLSFFTLRYLNKNA